MENKPTREQIRKEFDESFPATLEFSKAHAEAYKDFYDSKIEQILKELVGEEKPSNGFLLTRRAKHGDMEKGYNQKRSEIEKKIKELGF